MTLSRPYSNISQAHRSKFAVTGGNNGITVVGATSSGGFLVNFFTAQRHAIAVYAIVMCLSVCLSRVDLLLKRLNGESRKQRCTIAQGL